MNVYKIYDSESDTFYSIHRKWTARTTDTRLYTSLNEARAIRAKLTKKLEKKFQIKEYELVEKNTK